jgi:hypothetical protein
MSCRSSNTDNEHITGEASAAMRRAVEEKGLEVGDNYGRMHFVKFYPG